MSYPPTQTSTIFNSSYFIDTNAPLTLATANQLYLKQGGTGTLSTLGVAGALACGSLTVAGSLACGSLTVNGVAISNSPPSLTFANGSSTVSQTSHTILLQGSNANEFVDTVRIVQPGSVLANQPLLRMTNTFLGQSVGFIAVQAPTAPAPNLRLCSYASAMNITSGNTGDEAGIYLAANNGSIGIGTFSPSASYKLDLNGNLRVQGLTELKSTATVCQFSYSGALTNDRLSYIMAYNTNWEHSLGGSTHPNCPNGLYWYNGGYRMSLNSSGYLGVGIASGTCPLDVAISSNITTTTNISINTFSYNIATNSSNNQGGGPYTAPGVSIRARGNIWCQDTLFATSDRRTKENIEPIDFDLDHFMKLNPVSFNFKNQTRSKLGLIAQELNKICGEAVILVENPSMKKENEDDIEGFQMLVDYNCVSMLNTVAIKKILTKLDNLEAKLTLWSRET